MMKMKKLGLMICVYGSVFALIGMSALPANAQTTKWVFQAEGSDGNDGNTEAMAYATLQFAIDNSTSGIAGTPSVINVKDGTYGAISAGTNPCFTEPAAIIVQNLDFLTIQAAPGQNPKIMPGVGNIVSLAIDNSDHVIVDNIDSDQSTAQFDHWHVCNSEDLTVRNSTFEGANAEDGIDFETSHKTAVIEHNTFRDMIEDTLDFSDGAYSDVYIQDNVFEPNQRRPILIRTLSADVITGFTIQRNMFLGTNDQEAIRLIGADDIRVVNNVIMNSTQQGLYIDSGSTNIDVLHNSFFNNGEEEIKTKESGNDIVIKNNILYANGTSAAISVRPAFGSGPLPSENFNLIFNEGTDSELGAQTAITNYGGGTITGFDPLFVSTTASSEDLHLTVSSPAIEAGMELGVTDDIEKGSRPRPAATNPDIGAYEFPAIPIQVDIDIKFLSDPNAFNCKKRGDLPLTIFGTDTLDVNDIDVSSLRLALASDTSITTASGPVDSSITDRGDPSDAGIAMDGVDIFNPDGFDDLDVSFDSREVATLIGCGSLNRGDASPTLVLTGQLNDGTPLESVPVDDLGIDQLAIKNK